MARNRNKKRKPRFKKGNNQASPRVTSAGVKEAQPARRTRGEGKRPARVHRTVRLDVNMAQSITELSREWSRSESEVIRELVGAGLQLASKINQRSKML